jgi:hypothetical protein
MALISGLERVHLRRDWDETAKPADHQRICRSGP